MWLTLSLRFKKSNEIFVLGISDSECSLCCQSEPLLKELQDLFQSGKFQYKNKPILIARVDTSLQGNILEKEDIVFEALPKVLIVK